MAADPANSQLQHTIDIKVITDGEHHVLDRLDAYRGLFQMVVAEPVSPKHLGFEAQRFLASGWIRITTFTLFLKMTCRS